MWKPALAGLWLAALSFGLCDCAGRTVANGAGDTSLAADSDIDQVPGEIAELSDTSDLSDVVDVVGDAIADSDTANAGSFDGVAATACEGAGLGWELLQGAYVGMTVKTGVWHPDHGTMVLLRSHGVTAQPFAFMRIDPSGQVAWSGPNIIQSNAELTTMWNDGDQVVVGGGLPGAQAVLVVVNWAGQISVLDIAGIDSNSVKPHVVAGHGSPAFPGAMVVAVMAQADATLAEIPTSLPSSGTVTAKVLVSLPGTQVVALTHGSDGLLRVGGAKSGQPFVAGFSQSGQLAWEAKVPPKFPGETVLRLVPLGEGKILALTWGCSESACGYTVTADGQIKTASLPFMGYWTRMTATPAGDLIGASPGQGAAGLRRGPADLNGGWVKALGVNENDALDVGNAGIDVFDDGMAIGFWQHGILVIVARQGPPGKFGPLAIGRVDSWLNDVCGAHPECLDLPVGACPSPDPACATGFRCDSEAGCEPGSRLFKTSCGPGQICNAKGQCLPGL